MTPNQQINYKAGVTADIQVTREENKQAANIYILNTGPTLFHVVGN